MIDLIDVSQSGRGVVLKKVPRKRAFPQIQTVFYSEPIDSASSKAAFFIRSD
jgi:hypothetical protein